MNLQLACLKTIAKNPEISFQKIKKSINLNEKIANLLIDIILHDEKCHSIPSALRGVTIIKIKKNNQSKEKLETIFNQFRDTLEILEIDAEICLNNLVFTDYQFKSIKNIKIPSNPQLLAHIATRLPKETNLTLYVKNYKDIINFPLTFVRKLIILDSKITNEQLQKMSVLYQNLEELDFSFANNEVSLQNFFFIRSSWINSFKDCNFLKLRTLNVSRTDLTNKALMDLSKQCGKSLEELTIYDCEMITSFKNCKFSKLKKLNAIRSGLTDQGLQELIVQCASTLTILWMSDSRVTRFEKSKFPNLISFAVSKKVVIL